MKLAVALALICCYFVHGFYECDYYFALSTMLTASVAIDIRVEEK